MKFKSIQELVDAIKAGEVDETQLSIHLDNDASYISDAADDLFEGDGYYDIEPLYKALFPKANVEWVRLC